MMHNYRWMLACGAAIALLSACGSQPAEAPAAEAPAGETTTADFSAPPAPPPAPVTFADVTGDPVAGKRLFVQCQACHSLKEGENRVGPSLYNIVGLKAGHLEDFRYSDSNKSSGIIWTEETLFDYLKNPRAMVPGTTMAFAGIADPQKRADLIAFLKTNGAAS